MKIIKGNLILTKDTTFSESIKVEGDIKGYYNLKVAGNINARNIDARDINAWDIDARDINAWNINAWNIDAMDIVCEKRIKKLKTSKTVCRVYVKNKYSLARKEVGDKLI